MTDKLRDLDWKSELLILAATALVVIPRVVELNAFIAFDEPLYWRWSNQFFQALLNRDWTATLVGVGNPGVVPLLVICLGLLPRYLMALFAGQPPAEIISHLHLDQDIVAFSDMAARRLPMGLFNAIVVLVLLFLVYRQLGRNVALVATILLALDPFLLSDSRTMRADALMSVLMTISAISLLIYLDEGKWPHLLFSSVMVGVAFANKYSAMAMAPFVLVMVGLFTFWRTRSVGWPRSLWTAFITLVVWGGLPLLMLWLIWPALWAVPGAVFELVIPFIINTTIEGRFTFFMGEMYTNELLPLFYVVIILLRISPLVLIGLTVGLVSLFSKRRLVALKQQVLIPEQVAADPRRRTILTVGGLLVYALSVWLVMTIGILKRDHYVMPVFPALDILGAVGLVWLIDILANTLSNRFQQLSRSWLVGAAIGLILLVQAMVVLPHHPYYYSYYNPLILGSRIAPRVTMINWGPGLGEAAHYINAQANPERLKVASPTLRKFVPQIKGEVIRFVYGDPWIQADYLVVPFEDVQLDKIVPAYHEYATRQPLAREVILGGIPFAWVYEGPAADYYANSKLDGLGLLLGYDLDEDPVSAEETISLKLFWQNDGAGEDDIFFVRLVSADGYVWTEGQAQPLPGYEEAALTDETVVESQAHLEIPPGTPPGTYFLTTGFRSAKTNEVLGIFQLPSDGDKLKVTRPTRLPSTGDVSPDHPLGDTVASQLTLLGYSLPEETLLHVETNWLTLFWQAESVMETDYVMALQLLDAQDQEVAYWLGRPVMSGYPTNEWASGEIVRDPWRLDLPAELAYGPYTLWLTLFEAKTEAEVGRVALGDVLVVKRRQQFTIPVMARNVNTDLDGRVTLLGYDLETEPITGGGRLRLMLYWRPQQVLADSYTVFVHLLDPQGAVVAQHDGVPADGAIPTHDWTIGEVVTDRHLVEFPDLPAGEYRLVVGMYDPMTGQRLPVSGGDTAILLQTLPIN